MTDPASRPDASANPVALPRKGGIAQKLPILVILAVAALGAFLLRDQLSFAALAENRETLIAFRDANYLLAVLVFVAAYTAIVGFSLPGATIATLTGGFLFGTFPGVLFNVTGATLGAMAIFLAARAGFGARFAGAMEARGGAAARLQAGLRENEWSVLFLMRLVPAVPFFLANLIPAFVGVKFHRFAISTFFGIMPGALVYTSVGAGLGEVFARGETPDLSIIFAPHVLGPILGLAALSALPILIKTFRKKDI
ncbi:MAG: TVP38/TMEM64 family protein [Pseudorhodobacter sp.]